MDSTGHSNEHKKDIRNTYDKVRKLFMNVSPNRNLDNLFLSRDALNYCRAYGIPNTASIHGANADYQTNNLWAGIHNKTIQNADLTDAEKSFLSCLRYMMCVESLYSQIVDKICYLLVWQTDPPGTIQGENRHCCKNVDAVDTISRRCTLATKCEFLSDNGFGDLAAACDVRLRNAIGHMSVVIGKPTAKRNRWRTETAVGFKTEFSIEGKDIYIRRHTAGSADKWEIVNVNSANYRLEMAVWRYSIAFSLCQDVNEWLSSPMFLHAINNPDDPHYRITFSKGSVSLKHNANPDMADQ